MNKEEAAIRETGAMAGRGVSLTDTSLEQRIDDAEVREALRRLRETQNRSHLLHVETTEECLRSARRLEEIQRSTFKVAAMGLLAVLAAAFAVVVAVTNQ